MFLEKSLPKKKTNENIITMNLAKTKDWPIINNCLTTYGKTCFEDACIKVLSLKYENYIFY